MRMYERAKTQPCVVLWSLGNEAGHGPVHDAAAAWLRSRDPSRPIHYEVPGCDIMITPLAPTTMCGHIMRFVRHGACLHTTIPPQQYLPCVCPPPTSLQGSHFRAYTTQATDVRALVHVHVCCAGGRFPYACH
jgi:hypothetical protein